MAEAQCLILHLWVARQSRVRYLGIKCSFNSSVISRHIDLLYITQCKVSIYMYVINQSVEFKISSLHGWVFRLSRLTLMGIHDLKIYIGGSNVEKPAA